MAALAALIFAPVGQPARGDGLVEVVVTLEAPPLAQAIHRSRVLSARFKAQRLNLRAPTSVGVPPLARDRAARARHAHHRPHPRRPRHLALPGRARRPRRPRPAHGARPARRRAGRRARLAERHLPAAARPQPEADRRRPALGACRCSDTAGNGIKIGIIDDGVDQTHPFFNPSRLHDAARLPEGQHGVHDREGDRRARLPGRRRTRGSTRKHPFDPKYSEHATHVAGIAAGDYTPSAIPNRGPLSGVAPNAYLGNYKVLTVPTENFGLNGNAPEIAAGIEAAVRDGMDVINLSLGEPEIEPVTRPRRHGDQRRRRRRRRPGGRGRERVTTTSDAGASPPRATPRRRSRPRRSASSWRSRRSRAAARRRSRSR